MMRYVEEVRGFLKNKAFVLSYLLLALISFGFATANPTFSIDDTAADLYVGSGNNMLAAGRFGFWFWHFLLGRWEHAWYIDIVALLLLFASLVNFCILFKWASGGKIANDALTVFACMVLTYPMIIDIWEYTGANANIFASYLMTSGALLLIRQQIHAGGRPWKLVGAAMMLTLVCAGYESVVAVYIFLVCAVLALQVVYGSEKEKTLGEVLRQALIYAGMLALGVVLRVLIHRLTLLLLGIPAATNGATEIFWTVNSPKEIILKLIGGWGFLYVFAALKYLPVTILVLCVVVFLIGGIVCCRKYGAVLLLPGAGMLLSLVIISLVQGTPSPYRTCQVFAFFCGFVAMMVVHALPKEPGRRSRVRMAAVVLLGCCFLNQASFINYFLELNHRRSEQERFIIQQIGTELDKREDTEKPVIFVGSHSTDPHIIEAASLPEDSLRWKAYRWLCLNAMELAGIDPASQPISRKIPDTILNSMLQWAMWSFESTLSKMFNYYGFDYVPASRSLYDEAAAYAEESGMPAYPCDGYVEDVGPYVIVHLQ